MLMDVIFFVLSMIQSTNVDNVYFPNAYKRDRSNLPNFPEGFPGKPRKRTSRSENMTPKEEVNNFVFEEKVKTKRCRKAPR